MRGGLPLPTVDGMKALAYLLLLVLACSSELAVAKPKERRPSPQHAPPPAHRVPPVRPVPAPVVPSHWHGGRWHHGHHDGRLGWWWVVGTMWYFYDYPVWPYWYERERVIVVEQEAPPAGPPPPAYWYWCDSPKGYYPYVAQCAVEWKPVLAATPPPPPAPGNP